jgi:hypothetical protein
LMQYTAIHNVPNVPTDLLKLKMGQLRHESLRYQITPK